MLVAAYLQRIYQKEIAGILWILVPLTWLYRAIVGRKYQQRILDKLQQPPVVVIGNITLGGVGKTPIVAQLAQVFSETHSVVIISRGYGAQLAKQHYPALVTATANTRLYGDEPVMLAQITQCPVVIAPDRLAAYRYACEKFLPDLVLSDDGLQHYALPRAYEVCVLDNVLGVGNGYCLPTGPLREPLQRLNAVDMILVNSGHNGDDLVEARTSDVFDKHCSALQAVQSKIHSYQRNLSPFLHRVSEDESVSLSVSEFKAQYGTQVDAVCAIGNSERFFYGLQALGFQVRRHAFADHYAFDDAELQAIESRASVVVMTRKDAVKCKNMALKKSWLIDLSVSVPDKLLSDIAELLGEKEG